MITLTAWNQMTPDRQAAHISMTLGALINAEDYHPKNMVDILRDGFAMIEVLATDRDRLIRENVQMANKLDVVVALKEQLNEVLR